MWSQHWIGLPGVQPTPAVTLQGLAADRPPASSDNEGWLYLATDTNGGTLYRSDGTAWTQASGAVSGGGGDVYKDGVPGGQYIIGGTTSAGFSLSLFGNADSSDQYGKITIHGRLLVSGGLYLTGISTPTILTASVDDWAPTQLKSSSAMLLTADAAWEIRGIDVTQCLTTAGPIFLLINTSAFNITLVDEAGTSTASYRFGLNGNRILKPEQSVWIIYDYTAGRWRAVDGGLVSLTAGVTGTLPIVNGGTGTTSTTYCSLTANVTGTLPVTNGGTGVAFTTAYAVMCGGTVSTGPHQPIASVGTAGQFLGSNGAGALPTMQALTAASDTAAGVQENADQSEMEAASSTTRTVTPGRVQNHPGVCKGWITFDGTAGVPAAAASYNVSGIVDTAAGRWGITWATDFATADYSWTGSCDIALATNNNAGQLQLDSKATTQLNFEFVNSAAGNTDTVETNIQAWGDQ